MKVIILGSTGMLGQALTKEGKKRGLDVISVSRNNADINIDIAKEDCLNKVILDTKPNIIINTVAITNLIECEKRPNLAYLVNTHPAAIITEIARNENIYFIQISTDHYFTGDGDQKHNEKNPVVLLNNYARTKYAAEQFVLTLPSSLVVRTNIVGFRSKENYPTFIEWAITTIKSRKSMTLFEDFFTSSIDVRQFSSVIFDLLNKKVTGLLNVASREVTSKKQFIELLADRLGYQLMKPELGSVKSLVGVSRAESLGLDVSKAEKILGYKLPNLQKVIDSLVLEYKEDMECNMTV